MNEQEYIELLGQLMDQMADAMEWGKKHRWPVLSKYPQFAESVSIANKFCDAGGHAMMLEVIEASADYDETYPSMLNHFFKGIDGWMA